jgi:hypothetical protein
LYAGRYDQQDIAAELDAAGYELDDFDCSCIEQVGEYLFTTNWDDSGDWEGWTHAGSDTLEEGNPDFGAQLRYGGPAGFVMIDNGILRLFFGLSYDPDRIYKIYRISATWKADEAHTAQAKIEIRTNATGAPWSNYNFPNTKVWTEISQEWESPGRHMDSGGNIRLSAQGGVAGWCHFDNIEIDFDMWIP